MGTIPTNQSFEKNIGNNITDDYYQIIRGSDKTVLLWIDAAGSIQGVWANGIAAAIAAATTPPGGATTNVQINTSGAFYGDGNFTYNPITQAVGIRGTLSIASAVGNIFAVDASGNTTISNPIAATSLANQNSPIFTLAGTVWSGSASESNTWTIQNVVAAGIVGTGQILTITPNRNANAQVSIDATLDIGEILSSTIFADGNIETVSAAAGPGGNISSYALITNGSWWSGAAAVTSSTSITSVVGAGSTPTEFLTIANSGAYNWGGVNIVQGNLTQTAAHGETLVSGTSSELLTLDTGSTHTDTAGNLLPAGAIIDSVVIRVTTTISGGSMPTTIAVGDAGTSNRFISTGTPLTSGSTAVGLNQIDAGTSSQAAAAKVRVTLDQTPGQGAVRITVFWRHFTAPTS